MYGGREQRRAERNVYEIEQHCVAKEVVAKRVLQEQRAHSFEHGSRWQYMTYDLQRRGQYGNRVINTRHGCHEKDRRPRELLRAETITQDHRRYCEPDGPAEREQARE